MMTKAKKSVFLTQVEEFLKKNYGEAESKEIIQKSWARYEEICQENKDEPTEMYVHTRERIYPAIATFDAQISHGKSRQEATSLILEYYAWRSNIMGQKINKMMKFPFLYKAVPGICRVKMKVLFGETYGFQSNFYETPKSEVRFDMVACPYANICKKYGCPEIVKAFCDADDISFGSMHKKLIFTRTKTLANGDDCCDFCLKQI